MGVEMIHQWVHVVPETILEFVSLPLFFCLTLGHLLSVKQVPGAPTNPAQIRGTSMLLCQVLSK
jgi:hypothetical protein